MVRGRLYLGLIPLLLLVVGTGIYAIAVCRRMGGSIQREVLASYEASLAGERMRADAARMDLDAFKRELLQQAQAAAATEREPRIAAIDSAYQRVLRLQPGSPGPGPGSLTALARKELALHQVIAAIDDLQRFDYASARAAEARASSLATTSIRIMGLVIVLAFLLCLGLAWRMVRWQRTMEATLHSTPDPLLVVSRDGRAVVRNPAAEALAASGAWEGGYPPGLAEPLQEVLRSGRHFIPVGYESVVSLRPGGETRHYLPRILAIGDRLTGFGGAALLLQDVTKFRLLDDAKSNLVGTVSHELKTPLTSLRMAVHLLLEQGLGELTDRQRDLVETARDDAERLLRILGDLLDLTRLESGLARLDLQEVGVAGLLRDMAREIQPLASANGQRVVVETPPGALTVRVDPERIRHVFINLLSNAAKYAPPRTTITLYALAADDGFVRCGVRDEGPGIPPESTAAIFEKFYRLPGEAGTGAGLGLAIAREIVLAHGGTIACTSRPGQGSDFHFLLPGNTSRPAATIRGSAAPAPMMSA